MDEVVFIIQKRAINTNPAGLFASGLSSFAFLGVNMFSAIPNLGIKQGVGYAWRGYRQQGRFLLHAKSAFTPSLAIKLPSSLHGFTAFLVRHAPHPKPSENAQTGNC